MTILMTVIIILILITTLTTKTNNLKFELFYTIEN